MLRKTVLGVVLALFLSGALILINVPQSEAIWIGTVYILADGSVDPPNAPLVTDDFITYYLTDHILSYGSGIIVQRDNIIIDGLLHTVSGSLALDSKGIDLYGRQNVTVKNMRIINFEFGIWLSYSSNNIITENKIENNAYGIRLTDSSFNSIKENNVTGNGAIGIMLWYSSNHNYIAWNNITGNGEGISLTDSSNYNNIGGNNIAGNGAGISLKNSLNNVISGNNIAGNGAGISLANSLNNVISGNNIAGNEGNGIVFSVSSNNSIIGNYISGNSGFGFDLYESSNNTITGNTFINDGLIVEGSYQNVVLDNAVNGKPLVYLEGASNYTITDAGQVILVNSNGILAENLNLSAADVGVQLWNTTNSIVSGNSITNNWESGIWLHYSSNNSIIGNYISGNGFSYGSVWLYFSSSNNIAWNLIVGNNVDGIELNFSPNNSITSNSIAGNEWNGIRTYESLNLLIARNNITGNKGSGINLGNTLNSIISENKLMGNDMWGIDLGWSSNNSITWNNIMGNGANGTRLIFSSGNSITGNSITNHKVGIELISSSSNVIYHNNFINYLKNAYTTLDSNNTWDYGYPFGGNYWSDYIGVDYYRGSLQNQPGSDGIGDIPYVIDANNKDDYPLMGPFGGLTIIGQDVTVYPSSIVCLIFENVTAEGLTSVNVTDVGPEPPSGFKLAGKYYHIETTASYTGKIKIRIIYGDANMTQEEAGLRLMQYNETLQQWVNITTYLDIENNVIYGETTHLSPFAIFAPLPARDIAITRITFSKQYPAVNETIQIYVTIENRGTTTETFDVSVNYTLLVDPMIGTQTITLEPGATVTLSFTWTPTATGRYEIKAYTSPIPEDINPEDNTLTAYTYVGSTGSGGGGGAVARGFHVFLLF